MYKPESILEDENHKVLFDFEIQRDNLFPVSKQDPVLINKNKKRTCRIVDFAVLADH